MNESAFCSMDIRLQRRRPRSTLSVGATRPLWSLFTHTFCQLSQSCSEGSFSARNTLHLFHPLFYWHPTHPSYLTVNFTPLKWTSPSLTLRPDESPITASNNALGLSLKHLLLASYSIICIHLMSTLPLRQEGRPVSLSGSPLYLQYPAQHMAYDGCSAKIC